MPDSAASARFRPRSTIRVNVVEHDAELREALATGLARAGFDVTTSNDAGQLYRSLVASPCELVVIDAALPDEPGLAVAAYLRRHRRVGIVVLEARNRIVGRRRVFKSGADAFVAKPVDASELAAALMAIHGRVWDGAATGDCDGTWQLTNGGWSLRGPDGRALPLTTAERQFLQCLFRTPGRTVPRGNIIASLGGNPRHVDPHRVDVLVNRLRTKAAKHGMEVPVHAVRSAGYVLTSPVATAAE